MRHYNNRRSVAARGHKKRSIVLIGVVCALVVVLGIGTEALMVRNSKKVDAQPTKKTTVVALQKAVAPTTLPAAQPVAVATPKTACSSNTLDQLILVSINQRHLWACEYGKQVYDSAVVTGNMNLAADLTPVGTYHIYGKQTNLYLNGSDSTGSWHDYVNYWMPFLDNQYGAYGLHDATWRADSDFGNIDPYSSKTSHGCVELPLATATWLYNWDHIGTTVTIES